MSPHSQHLQQAKEFAGTISTAGQTRCYDALSAEFPVQCSTQVPLLPRIFLVPVPVGSRERCGASNGEARIRMRRQRLYIGAVKLKMA